VRIPSWIEGVGAAAFTVPEVLGGIAKLALVTATRTARRLLRPNAASARGVVARVAVDQIWFTGVHGAPVVIGLAALTGVTMLAVG
jgi:hypothetical protein